VSVRQQRAERFEQVGIAPVHILSTSPNWPARASDPVPLDVSLREPCFSSYVGHTPQNKLRSAPW
jgi:hypothetical protein